MGRRGPKAGPLKTADTPREIGAHCFLWERPGLSRAARVIIFVESLPITSGMHAGRRFRLRPWQKKIVKALYRTRGGRRVVRKALLTLPRKNGKTALAAALALAHLIGPEAEQRGQVYSAAADRGQASIIFAEMEAVIGAVPEFAARCNVQRFRKAIEDDVTGSVYHALSSDDRKAHGLSPSFVVYDELAQARTRHLFDNLDTGAGARREPLMVVISTQSSDHHHVMSELVEYGRKVLDGVIEDETFLPIIYAAPPDADPWSEEVWRACNPALGDFRSLEEMRQFAAQAKRIPAKETVFRALYLNQPVEVDGRFIAQADWEACRGEVDPEALRGRPCWAGLDLGSTTDLTALVLYFPEDGGAVLPFFWVPAENLDEREDDDRVPYRTWASQGLIETTPGRAIDRRAIAMRLAEVASRFDLKGVAYDRWRIEDLKVILADEGIELPLTPWGQGFKDMAPAVDLLEAGILQRQIAHGGHPVLTWCASNVVIETDPAGGRKISKSRSREKVDGTVALTMAMGLHARAEVPAAPPAWLERGLLAV
ncbi:Terminase [Desulfarculus baarsii DSM 2075]|uniref:Terminase n=1 Tax=Desulfarculus baarsii (strain ATCC 33931 / DSM 2075 / LMG 7858 / VKM B-1802 / 2st14) TaxID=644282 RepID=E1QJ60_DESB2|nr:terminase TerL endonuclease subunit [Desulfarculus baarsii]ADK85603.1 Terminase [Desulfarculus baarsii DSM 2075]